MKRFMIASLLVLIPVVSSADEEAAKLKKLVEHLQKISVTVKAESAGRWGNSVSEGSGVVVVRKLKDKTGKEHTVNFVWTAGHVIDGLRKVRTVTDPKTGSDRKLIEFDRPQIVQELFDSDTGQRIGEVKLDTVVLCYSDADTGEDLALLMVIKRNFLPEGGAEFFLNKEIPSMGTRVCHVGSRHGQFGSNSFSAGRVSQIGRVFKDVHNKIFDQTSVPASPGSSGGGMFLETGEDAGKVVGLLVRGGESTFNFIVPVRRMVAWAKKMHVTFALDPKGKMPLVEDLKEITIDDGWANRDSGALKAKKHFSTKTLLLRSDEPVKAMKKLVKISKDRSYDPIDTVKEWKALSDK